MSNADSARDTRASSGEAFLQGVVFLCLLMFAAILECRMLSSLRDPEIWGHLRVGTWILQNKAWPRFGLFSQAANLPWQDYSWGFALVTAIAYRVAGYAAIPGLLIVLRLGLAVGSFVLAGGWRNFWSAAALSVVAQYVLLWVGPGPVYVSVLFFTCEACILWGARESGDARRLVALPFLFLPWANFDTGFVYGLALYLIFLAALAIEARLPSGNVAILDRTADGLPLARASWIGAACMFACFLNPYGFQPYISFFANELSRVNANLDSYHALGFRQPQDYVLMLLGMAAYLALGLARSRDFFQIGALVGATALAFHAQREGWLLALTAVAVIGHAIRKAKLADASPFPWQWNRPRLALLAAALICSLGIFFLTKGREQNELFAKGLKKFPIGAADFLRQNPQPGPFFNDYNWGAFLTWYLPEVPVAIDSRRDLYPEETELGYFKAMNADIPYRDYPPMNQARTLLMDKSSVMGQALRGAIGFQVIYEDDLAIVYSHPTKEQP